MTDKEKAEALRAVALTLKKALQKYADRGNWHHRINDDGTQGPCDVWIPTHNGWDHAAQTLKEMGL